MMIHGYSSIIVNGREMTLPEMCDGIAVTPVEVQTSMIDGSTARRTEKYGIAQTNSGSPRDTRIRVVNKDTWVERDILALKLFESRV